MWYGRPSWAACVWNYDIEILMLVLSVLMLTVTKHLCFWNCKSVTSLLTALFPHQCSDTVWTSEMWHAWLSFLLCAEFESGTKTASAYTGLPTLWKRTTIYKNLLYKFDVQQLNLCTNIFVCDGDANRCDSSLLVQPATCVTFLLTRSCCFFAVSVIIFVLYVRFAYLTTFCKNCAVRFTQSQMPGSSCLRPGEWLV